MKKFLEVVVLCRRIEHLSLASASRFPLRLDSSSAFRSYSKIVNHLHSLPAPVKYLPYRNLSRNIALFKKTYYTPILHIKGLPYSSTSNLPDTQFTASMDAKTLSNYILHLEQPISYLECTEAFNGLTGKEKLYAHYFGEAAWNGGLITTVQISPESPLIVALLLDIFKSNGIEGLKNISIKNCGFTEDEWKAFVVYACGVFANAGNYKGFGDTKIIPGVPVDKVGLLVDNAKFTGIKNIQEVWSAVKDRMYSLSTREKQLGLGEKGTTTYFSENCTTEDAELINRFMKKTKTEAYNTRLFKTVQGANTHYEIRSASVDLDEGVPKECDFEGAKVVFTKGDYSPILKKCVEYLVKAKEFAANENQVNMIEKYIESFVKGSLRAHIDGSRCWIKDKGPAVETYIGFIETYRDPFGTRGEFEAFVSMVNRPMSAKFTSLVDNAGSFLKLLPWPQEYEKETFMKPDFTSLDVLTFAGSGVPAGINIPNYEEIRQVDGFKNVSLGNVILASFKSSVVPFLKPDDKELLDKYRIPSFEVQVGLHELLGHGSGKMMMKKEDGTTNFQPDLKNPLNNELVESLYEPGETYDSVFLTIGSAFEECRAECVGLLLSLDDEVLRIFGYEGEEAENIIYVNWLSMIFAGAAKALEMYQPETKAWMQAHSQARYAILQVLIEAGEGLVEIKEIVGSDGKPDLIFALDESKIKTVGRKAISDFLLKLQVYRALADIKSATKMFGSYTDVHDDGVYPWATWRDIIMDKKQPRKINMMPNTYIADDNTVMLKNYEATQEGLIQSWIDRFSGNFVYEALEHCWKKDKPYF